MRIIGRWQDQLRGVGDKYWDYLHGDEFEWDFNQIQNTFATLLASWCRSEPSTDSPVYARIGFMGIGEGLVGWDTTPPAQPYTDTTLTTEYFRKAIPQTDIVYIDPITNVSTGGVPSPKLEITVNLLSGEANGDLREFGLFGGDATITLDTGQMVNWVVHSKIVKDSSLEIQRKIRLEFLTQ